MRRLLTALLLFILTAGFIAQAAGVAIYINNKPYGGKTFVYETTIYVDAVEILDFLGIHHSSTPTSLNITDPELQKKFYSIAVWVDYKDGRGQVISFPLKNAADVMEGRYIYYPETNTIDMYTFTRTVEVDQTQPAITNNTNSAPAENPNSAVSSGNGTGGVNPFNTGGILNDAQNAADSYEGQINSGGF